MRKKFGFWIAVSFFVLALISLAMYFLKADKKEFSDEMIVEVARSFKQDLKVFLNSAEASVSRIKNDARNIDADEFTADELNRYFSTLVQEEKYLQGVVIFGDSMNYLIYREEDTWVTTHSGFNDTLIEWTRLNNNLQKTGNWMNPYNFFMEQEQFDVLKVADLEVGEHMWRTAYSPNPSNQDLFFNIFKINEISGNDIFAFLYRTRELGTRFSKVLQFDNPLVSILTSRGKVVTPIRTDDTNKIKMYGNLSLEVEKAFQVWEGQQPDSAFTVSFSTLNQEFWVGLDSITPQLGATGFAVTISQEDLIENKKKTDEILLYLTLLFFIFAVAAFLPVARKKKGNKQGPDKKLSDLPQDEIKQLISQGESELVEFKSSLRWDFRQEKVNKALEDVILKSISAFANAKGGTLFIGVTDDLEVIGLEHDFQTFKKNDVDYFELHLRKLINNQFSIRFSNKHLLMQFPEIDGKVFCVIRVQAADVPLYVKTKDKQGHEIEKFYVRSGNASQEITSLKEINEYIKSHFSAGD